MPNRLPPTLLLLASALLAACSSQPQPSSDPNYQRLMQLAADLDKRGDPASAAALYQNAAQQPGEHPDAWRKLGDTSLAAGDARAAERAYQQALTLQPGDLDTLLGLGTAQLRQGKLERAVTALTQAAHSGNRADAWSRLGVAQVLRGDASSAQSAFQRSLALAPDDLDTRCNLALAYALGGQAQAALQSIAEVTRSPRAVPRHQRNALLVTVLAGREQDVANLPLDDISASERQALLEEARRIKAINDPRAQAQTLGLVDGR